MNLTHVFLLSLSIILPTITGTVRIKRVPIILPLLICFYLGLLVEITQFLIKDMQSLHLISNVYVLIEFVLLMVQLRLWGAFRNKPLFLLLVILGVVLWGFTTFFYLDNGSRNYSFRLFYSCILALGCIELVNKLAFERIVLVKDYRFVICICFIVYYVYNIIVEALFISSLDFSNDFLKAIFSIKVFLNFATNILYFAALLCIPKKKTFTL